MSVPRRAPDGYDCPFCRMARGAWDACLLSTPNDIVYQNETVFAFIGAKQWPQNRGHVLVCPISHYENLYELPDETGAAVFRASRLIALALKEAYICDGVSTRQHNEPAGNQDVWHYHLHVFPRYTGDDLYGTQGALMPPDDRATYAARLRTVLASLLAQEGTHL